jgi:hypothetical protein
MDGQLAGQGQHGADIDAGRREQAVGELDALQVRVQVRAADLDHLADQGIAV